VITTVSISPCWKRPVPDALRRGLELLAAAVLALALLALAPAVRAQSANAEITQLRVELAEEGVLLSASVRFDLPPVIEDALAKGIPMFFVTEAVLFRDRWYWYDKQIVTAARPLRPSFQTPARRRRLAGAPVRAGARRPAQPWPARHAARAPRWPGLAGHWTPFRSAPPNRRS